MELTVTGIASLIQDHPTFAVIMCTTVWPPLKGPRACRLPFNSVVHVSVDLIMCSVHVIWHAIMTFIQYPINRRCGAMLSFRLPLIPRWWKKSLPTVWL